MSILLQNGHIYSLQTVIIIIIINMFCFGVFFKNNFEGPSVKIKRRQGPFKSLNLSRKTYEHFGLDL